jgi:hypothetical protein
MDPVLKYQVFSENFSKKFKKNKKLFCFHVDGQNPKIFQAYFLMFLKIQKINIITSL